jgi:integrase
MLSPVLLDLLRTYWKIERPSNWLFPGHLPDRPISLSAVQDACKQAGKESGLSKRVTVRALRHGFATHLLESETNVRTIQFLLGHRSLQTTARLHALIVETIHSTTSPLDLLKPNSSNQTS